MSDIALQLERLASGTVAANGNVVFDNIVYSDGDISYNSLNGVITFNVPGRYIINWWVATQSSSSTIGSVFSLSSSQGDTIEGATPIKTGDTDGFGIVDVVSAPQTLSLINSSGALFYLSNTVPVKASLMLVSDDPSEGATGPTAPCTLRIHSLKRHMASV
ncbi:MAG: hypothetical protein ACOYJD_00850 [Christensenellales bacterium]|jgi:hypothetical protein